MRLAADGERSPVPLFIHSGCGLGKTHPLQGLCRKVRDLEGVIGQNPVRHRRTSPMSTSRLSVKHDRPVPCHVQKSDPAGDRRHPVLQEQEEDASGVHAHPRCDRTQRIDWPRLQRAPRIDRNLQPEPDQSLSQRDGRSTRTPGSGPRLRIINRLAEHRVDLSERWQGPTPRIQMSRFRA